MSNEDLLVMYEKFSGGDRILLWCENIDPEREQPPPSKRKKKENKESNIGKKIKKTNWKEYIGS